MKPRAVIFDLFDTLLYVEETGTRETAIQLAAQHGVTRESWRAAWGEAFKPASRGAFSCLRDRTLWALRRAGLADPEPGLIDEMTGLLHVRDYPQLYPDVRPTLGILRERGYRLGLLSNIASDEREIVGAFGFGQMMDAVVLSCEVGCAKPEPAVFASALDRLAMRPEECVFVDDHSSFLAAAEEVGITGVRIRRENAHNRDKPGRDGEMLVRDLGELLSWLPSQAVSDTRYPIPEPRDPTMIRAVIFDLDNTLVDDDASARRAIAAACEEAAVLAPEVGVEQLGEAYWNVSLEVWTAIAAELNNGRSAKEITGAEFRRLCWSKSLAACGVNDEAVVERVAESYGHWRDRELEPFPEVEEVLAALRPRVKLAIITNGTADTHRRKLQLLGYDDCFDCCVVAGEFGPAKPDPEIFTYTAERLGVRPEECLMVGDNPETDVAGAKAAGMKAVWFRRELWPLPEGCPAPDYEIRDLREVVGIVEGESRSRGVEESKSRNNPRR